MEIQTRTKGVVQSPVTSQLFQLPACLALSPLKWSNDGERVRMSASWETGLPLAEGHTNVKYSALPFTLRGCLYEGEPAR